MAASVESYLFYISLSMFVLLLGVVTLTALNHVVRFTVQRVNGGAPKADTVHFVSAGFWLLATLFVLFEYIQLDGNVSEEALFFYPIFLPVIFAVHVVVIPLIRIRQRRHYSVSWLAYAAAFAVVLAMPLVATSALAVAMLASGEDADAAIAIAEPAATPSACDPYVRRLQLREWSEEDLNAPDKWKVVDIQFWYDNTFKAVALDLPDAFGCNLTTLRHNQAHPVISAAVASYRTLIAFVALILWYPVRRWWAARASGASARLLFRRGGLARSIVTVSIERVSNRKEVFRAELEVGDQKSADLMPDEEYVVQVTYERALRPNITKQTTIRLGPKSVHAIEFGVTSIVWRMGEDVYFRDVEDVHGYLSAAPIVASAIT